MTEQENQIVQLLAHAYLNHARPDKAAVLLAAADAVQPGRRGVLRALALAQVRGGEPAEALRTLERAALRGGADAAFHLLRAQALAACDRRIEAGAAMAACQLLRRSAGAAGTAAAPARSTAARARP